MSNGITYGINFPFLQSVEGDYVKLTQTACDLIYNKGLDRLQ